MEEYFEYVEEVTFDEQLADLNVQENEFVEDETDMRGDENAIN